MTKMYQTHSIRLLFFFIAIFALSSCAVRKERTLFNAPSDIITDTIKQVYVVNDQGAAELYYRIKINDLIAVRNVQNREFGSTAATSVNASPTSVSYQVQNDGSVNLPAIGKVQIAGLTRKEATEKLQKIYETKELKDPIIEVTVINLKVTLLGEFNAQGNYLLERDNTSLIEIIGEAGGITKNADPKTLKIIRGDRASPTIIYVNLNDINSLASKKLYLQNNDIIVLQPTKSSALSDKLQSINSVIQPLLVIINLGLLIYTFKK